MATAIPPEILEEQNDEVTALQSIFGDGFQLLSEIEDVLKSFQVLIDVQLPNHEVLINICLPGEADVTGAEATAANLKSSDERPNFLRSESGQKLRASFAVTALLPLNLHVTYTPGYPAESAPVFTISSSWLNGRQLSCLCEKLDFLWEENVGQSIVFSWIDWLGNETLSFLGLDSCLTLNYLSYVMGADGEADQPDERDPRALPECDDVDEMLGILLRRDFEKQMTEFQNADQECMVCFDEKRGSEFYRLTECKHHFCRLCLHEYCTLHVTEGTVQYLVCPEESCDTLLPPDIIRDLVGDESFARWETLTLQKSLNSMEDVVWCPRCNQVVITDPDKNLKLANCTNCFFSFCPKCYTTWHQGSDCPLASANELEKMEEKAKAAKSASESKLLQRKLEEMKSLYVIKKISKPCPHCRNAIEKNEGCNKMTCNNCGKYFCWLCGQAIRGYDHFGSSCTTFTAVFIPAPVIRPQQMKEGDMMLRVHLEQNADAVKYIKHCPTCRQRNLKLASNNHIRCWNCKRDFCYSCYKKIEGPLYLHYAAGAPCTQHSVD